MWTPSPFWIGYHILAGGGRAILILLALAIVVGLIKCVGRPKGFKDWLIWAGGLVIAAKRIAAKAAAVLIGISRDHHRR
jgi:hypothetical protein